jgi:O-succinylhomoserine sulfhydrylase
VVAFELKGGLEAGKQFFDRIKLLSLSANLGDSRSIVTHPASTTHSKLSVTERTEAGITDGMVRISVGLEHIDDIINDICQALG